MKTEQEKTDLADMMNEVQGILIKNGFFPAGAYDPAREQALQQTVADITRAVETHIDTKLTESIRVSRAAMPPAMGAAPQPEQPSSSPDSVHIGLSFSKARIIFGMLASIRSVRTFTMETAASRELSDEEKNVRVTETFSSFTLSLLESDEQLEKLGG